jgi:hypothetical protein
MSRLVLSVVVPLLLLAGSLRAVTLEKLSLEEMIDASTLVVRGTVSAAKAARSGSVIQTEYRVAVDEVLKADAASGQDPAASGELTVSLPGGEAGGVRQTLAGVPSLRSGEQYVFFLWRARSGRLLLVGMSQGLLKISGTGGRATASRPPVDGTLLDARTGMAVRDSGLGMRMAALRETISRRVRQSQGARR